MKSLRTLYDFPFNALPYLLKEKREELDLSIAKVSKATGISRTTIRDIENGKKSCTVKVLNRLITYYDLNDYGLEEDDDLYY